MNISRLHKKAAALGAGCAGVLMLGANAIGADAKPVIANEDLFDFDHVSCSGRPNEVRVVIDGLKKSIGLVTIDLYRSNTEAFLKGRGRESQSTFAAVAPKTMLCVTVPEPGDYAIAIYQDENANRKFDKGAFGLPAEPWGISNNPKVRFSPPAVEEALFSVDEKGAKVWIELN